MTRTGLGAHLPAAAQSKYQNHIGKVSQLSSELATKATIAFTQLNDAARMGSPSHLQSGVASFNQFMGLANKPDSRGIPLIANSDVAQVSAALQMAVGAVQDKLGQPGELPSAALPKPTETNWLLWGSLGLGAAVLVWYLTKRAALSQVA